VCLDWKCLGCVYELLSFVCLCVFSSFHINTHTDEKHHQNDTELSWWSTPRFMSRQSWTNDMSSVRTQRSSFIYLIRWRHFSINLKNTDFPAFSAHTHTEQGSMVSVWPFSQNAASLLFYKPPLSLALIVCLSLSSTSVHRFETHVPLLDTVFEYIYLYSMSVYICKTIIYFVVMHFAMEN